MSRAAALVSVAALGLATAQVQAQEVRVFVDGASARVDATPTLVDWAAARAPLDTVEPARLAVLAELEALLMDARRSAVRLEERDALRTLAQAERLAEANLTIPGMAAWYAEVELALALTAAQAGMSGLAEAALGRAASVDPGRTVQAAEARPEMVARSRAVARRVATGPRGRFEVRARAEGAEVFLDDRPLGALPRTIEASVGPHVLRVEAPGHRSWARVVDVLEGERAPVSIRLAPTAARAAALEAQAAAEAGELEALAAALARIASLDPPAVEVVWAGERAVAVRCDARGCGAPRRIAPEGEREGGTLADALRWRASTPIEGAAQPWWERWYVWAGAGAVLAAGIAALVAVLQPEGLGPRIFEVDVGALPTH